MDPTLAFFELLGPVGVAVLLLAKGRGWLTGLAHAENSGRRATTTGLVLVSLAALAILPCLGTTSLYDRDEGYYAECAREMSDGGDLLVPHFSGRPWMEKPPLTYWAMAGAMKLFGPTEFAARLPSAVAALLAIWLTFRLATRMYSPVAGVLAAAMLGTCALYGAVARLALLDTTLLCCVLLSMIGLWQFIEGGRRATLARPPSGGLARPPCGGLVLFYVGCGLGGLAKGPLGIALPLIALGGYLAWSRDWRLLPKMRPLRGALLILAIVALWVVPANWLTGGRYIYELVWESTLAPIFTPLQGHGGSDLAQYLLLLPAYLPALVLGFLPWSLFLVPALRRMCGSEGRQDRRAAFLGGWILAQLLAFSLVRTKLPHHILPILPALAILCGAFLAELLSGKAPLAGAWDALGSEICLFLLTAAGVAILLLPLAEGFVEEGLRFLPAGLLLIATALWVRTALARKRYDSAFIALSGGMILSFGLLWQIGLPGFEKGKSASRVARILRTHYGEANLPGVRFGRLGYREVSLLFYLGRPVEEIDGSSALKPFLMASGPAAAILPEKDLRKAIAAGFNIPYRTLWKEKVWIPEKSEWQNLLIATNEATAD